MIVMRAYEKRATREGVVTFLKRMKITSDPKVVREFTEKYNSTKYMVKSAFYEQHPRR